MVRDILSIPKVYEIFGKILNKKPIDFFFQHKQGIKVLDVGCGPGSQTHHFMDADYTGIDFSADYIEKANKKYGHYPNIKFHCSDLNIFLNDNGESEKFDLIFMCGVLHHISDSEVEDCLSPVSKLLKPDGEFRSLDGVFVDNQSRFAKWFLLNDRGRYVRTIKEYEKLIAKYFPNASYTIYDDLLRIPYTHIIFSSL